MNRAEHVQPESVRDQVKRIIRETLADAATADPSAIAADVLERLNQRQVREALAMCLPQFVRVELSHHRTVTRNTARGGLTSPERIRDWYARQLAVSLFVGAEWKFLRDCTADDLHEAAADRYKKASEVHAEGDRWTKVALFMEERGKVTASDITEDELKQLMEES